MVLYVTKLDIHPDKVEAYLEWTEGATRRVLDMGLPRPIFLARGTM